jgi:hypothetical protein
MICAGDSVTWARAFDGYPSTSWTLGYYLQMSGKPLVTVQATANPAGAGFLVNIPAATSAAWPAGQYAWKAVLTGTGPNAGQRVTADMAELVVLPDPTQTYDSRSHARKCYEAVTAEIERRAADSITRYKLGETEAYKAETMRLLEIQAVWSTRLRAEAGRPLVTTHRVVLR